MPIAPLPRTPSISYLPRCVGSAASLTAAPRPPCPRVPPCSFEHLHCLDERDLHPRERLGQHADLVLAPRLEFTGVEIAETDLVGNRRQARHSPDHHHVQ